jgi:hypothetical protein
MNHEDKVSKGLRMLREQGHQVESTIQHGRLWWEIDRGMLATPEEISQIADGMYSLAELEELFVKRHQEESGL